jgi:hypothetical protein
MSQRFLKDLLSIDDIQLMQFLECEQDSAAVKPRCVLFEPAQMLQVKEKLSSVAVLQHKVQLLLI